MPTLPGRRTNETARVALTTAAAVKRATAAIAGQLIRGTAIAASAADAAAADQHWGVLPPGRLATAAGSHKSPNAETAAATASLPTAAAAAHGGLQQCAAAIGRAVADNGICCSRPATNANHAYGPYFSIFNLCGDESTEHAATATLRWVDELACIATVISAHHVKLHGQHD